MPPPELAPAVAEIATLGIFSTVAAVILGYLSDKSFGAILLAAFSCAASVICLAGYTLFGTTGLVIAVILVTGLGALVGRWMAGSQSGKRRGAILVAGLWSGFCLAGWIGHMAGKWVGLLTITLPAVMIFWLSLYYLARFILAPDENRPVSTALRCLITCSAGTNFPYYALEDGEKVERVPGSQTSLLFSGPGIFLTGPDHVVVLSNNLKFTGVRGPGVVITKLWEVIQEPIDLRPQHRAYEVEAVTKDGIRVRVKAFVPFQLDAGAQQPEMGKPFPHRASSVLKAFHARPVDIERSTYQGAVTEERRQRRWDELCEIIATRVMQDILAEYKFNELCEALDPDKDPRVEITKAYQAQMKKELDDYGIKVLGGGVSNLLPTDTDAVFERRLMNWQAQWRRKMLERLGAAEAEAERLIGQTRAQVQAEMIQSISGGIAEVSTDDKEVIFNTIALRFIESLNQMVAQPRLRDQLPPNVIRTMEYLPRIIGGEWGDQDA
jgi:hypothetical protein